MDRVTELLMELHAICRGGVTIKTGYDYGRPDQLSFVVEWSVSYPSLACEHSAVRQVRASTLESALKFALARNVEIEAAIVETIQGRADRERTD